jgi:long-chain fatty acid transport protein
MLPEQVTESGGCMIWGSCRPEDKTDAVLSLNVNQLHRAGALTPGRVGQWLWMRDGILYAGIRLQGGKGHILLLYRYQNSAGTNEDVREVIRMVRRRSLLRGGKLLFLCPGRWEGVRCDRAVANLYGAGRYFVCRHCAGLNSPSWTQQVQVPAKLIRAGATVAGVAGLAASADALAGGFMVRENSAIGVGMVYAGNGSRADAASTTFNNPAGMTRLADDEIEFGSAVILPSIEFDGSATALGGPLTGNNGGNAGRIAAIPNLYWVFGLNDRLKAGIAVTAPFGNGIEYDPNWYGRYLGLKMDSLSADINPNIAFRVNDSLSIAGGVSAQYLKLDYSSAIPQFVFFGPGTADALYRFNADSWAIGFNLGVLLELQGGTRIGLTYRSGIDHRVTGNLDFTNASPLLGLISGSAGADVHLPATFGFSVTRDWGSDLSLSMDIQFSQWNVFKRVVIESQNSPFAFEQGFQDSWLVSIGGAYRLNESVTLRAGLGWDQTPVTDRYRAVTLPDEDRYLVGFGFGYSLTDSLALDGGYQHSFAAAHADMSNSLNNTDPVAQSVVMSGEYDVDVDVLAFALRFKY